jgi:hypothetical protein
MMSKVVKAVGAVTGGGVAIEVAAVGWSALAGIGLLLLMIVLPLCWVLISRERTYRLTSLIHASRTHDVPCSCKKCGTEPRADLPEDGTRIVLVLIPSVLTGRTIIKERSTDVSNGSIHEPGPS